MSCSALLAVASWACNLVCASLQIVATPMLGDRLACDFRMSVSANMGVARFHKLVRMRTRALQTVAHVLLLYVIPLVCATDLCVEQVGLHEVELRAVRVDASVWPSDP